MKIDSYIRQAVTQNRQLFPVRNHLGLRREFKIQRSFGHPAWVAMGNARAWCKARESELTEYFKQSS